MTWKHFTQCEDIKFAKVRYVKEIGRNCYHWITDKKKSEWAKKITVDTIQLTSSHAFQKGPILKLILISGNDITINWKKIERLLPTVLFVQSSVFLPEFFEPHVKFRSGMKMESPIPLLRDDGWEADCDKHAQLETMRILKNWMWLVESACLRLLLNQRPVVCACFSLTKICLGDLNVLIDDQLRPLGSAVVAVFICAVSQNDALKPDCPLVCVFVV